MPTGNSQIHASAWRKKKAFFFLHAEAWIWLFPVGISALVLFKWVARPQESDEEVEEEQGV